MSHVMIYTIYLYFLFYFCTHMTTTVYIDVKYCQIVMYLFNTYMKVDIGF